MRETRGHLVFRPEGEMWNAYWRPEEHSITGSVLLGSVRLNLAIERTSIKTGFHEANEASHCGIGGGGQRSFGDLG